MKLSEAIRLGSLTGPQIRGHLYDGKGGSCALGGVFSAIGVALCEEEDSPHLHDFWPWVDAPHRCPECNGLEPRVTFIISNHLNDDHRWTREKIAAWVASIEPKEEQSDGGQGQVTLEEMVCRK